MIYPSYFCKRTLLDSVGPIFRWLNFPAQRYGINLMNENDIQGLEVENDNQTGFPVGTE